MSDFLKKLKEKSQSKSGLAALKAQMEQGNGNSFKNDKIWEPQVDNAGNHSSIIRFLPPCPNEDSPYTSLYNHGFKIGEKWFIENCPTTLGKDHKCPVCEANSELWNTGIEENRQIVRTRKRKLSYYSNVLVISDSQHPENEGKVFIFRYGVKIYAKIQDAIKPDPALGEDAFEPFDLWEGANFRLIIRKVDGRRNYDKSKFDAPKPLSSDEQFLESLEHQLHGLVELSSSDKFKTYDELSTRYNSLVGVVAKDTAFNQTAHLNGPASAPQAATIDDDDDLARFKSMLNN